MRRTCFDVILERGLKRIPSFLGPPIGASPAGCNPRKGIETEVLY